jgi:tetratricopeptide (TPR) repeat protein
MIAAIAATLAFGEANDARETIADAVRRSGPASGAEVARRAVAAAPKDPDLRGDLVEALLDAGDLVRAEAAFAEWSRLKLPSTARRYELAGNLAARKGESAEALRLWMEGAALPGGAVCATAAEPVLRRDRRWPELDQMLGRAIAVARGDDDGLGRLRAWRGRARMQRRDWQGAGDDFRSATAMAPAEREVRALLPAWERLERDLPVLTKLEEGVRQAAPGDPMPFIERVALFSRHALQTPAMEDARAALDQFPESDSLRLLAAQLERAAGANTEAWRKLQPAMAVSGSSLAQEPVLIGRLVAADRAVLAAPGAVDPLLARIRLWRSISQPALALADADAVIAIEPGNGRALGERASALGRLDRPGELVAAWAAAERAGLEDAWLLVEAARVAADRGDYEGVLRLGGKAAAAGGDVESLLLEAERILGKRKVTQ